MSRLIAICAALLLLDVPAPAVQQEQELCPTWTFNAALLAWEPTTEDDLAPAFGIAGAWTIEAHVPARDRMRITTPAGIQVELKHKTDMVLIPGARSCFWIEEDFQNREWIRVAAIPSLEKDMLCGGVFVVMDAHPIAERAGLPPWHFVQVDRTFHGRLSLDGTGRIVAAGQGNPTFQLPPQPDVRPWHETGTEGGRFFFDAPGLADLFDNVVAYQQPPATEQFFDTWLVQPGLPNRGGAKVEGRFKWKGATSIR